MRNSNGLYMCVFCGCPIDGSMFDAGTGKAEEYAHPDCYWREEAYKERKKVEVLVKKLDNIMETICDDCYQHIENVNLKEELNL